MWGLFFEKRFSQSITCDLCQVTPGRLQHWVNRGHFRLTSKDSQSQKKKRFYSSADIFVIIIMVKLSNLGIPIRTISNISRQLMLFLTSEDGKERIRALRFRTGSYLILYISRNNNIMGTIYNDNTVKKDVFLCVNLDAIVEYMENHRTLELSSG